MYSLITKTLLLKKPYADLSDMSNQVQSDFNNFGPFEIKSITANHLLAKINFEILFFFAKLFHMDVNRCPKLCILWTNPLRVVD